MNENVEGKEKISVKQKEAIRLIVSGHSIEEISKKIKVNINTIYRWMKQEDFKNELTLKQDDISNCVFNKIKKLSTKALNVLDNLLEEAENENNKLKASMFIIDRMFQLNDEGFIERLDNIEELLKRNIRWWEV